MERGERDAEWEQPSELYTTDERGRRRSPNLAGRSPVTTISTTRRGARGSRVSHDQLRNCCVVCVWMSVRDSRRESRVLKLVAPARCEGACYGACHLCNLLSGIS